MVRSNIAKPIEKKNLIPAGYGHENVLTEISIDKETHDQLKKLHAGNCAQKAKVLSERHRQTQYGRNFHRCHIVHPHNLFMRVIGVIVDICGIDIMASNPSEPLKKPGGVILKQRRARLRILHRPANGLPRTGPRRARYALSARQIMPHSYHCHYGYERKTTTTRPFPHIVKNNGYR